MKNIEIAQMLQISPATVSLALNNKPGVSEETRRKILELKGASLKKDIEQMTPTKKGQIGLLVFKNRGDIIAETFFFMHLIQSINDDVSDTAYQLNITYATDPLSDFIDNLNYSGLAGLIIIATEMSEEDVLLFKKRLGIPFVLTDAAFPELNVDCVLMNNYSGINQAIKYGYMMGHRKIGMITSNSVCKNFTDRFDAYRLCLESLGLEYNKEYIFPVAPNIAGAGEDMERYLAEGRELPTLLVAANDVIAIGAANAIKKAGYSIPEDVSIIGFDDMPSVQCMTPPLTTVQLFQNTIAALAVNRLMQKIEDPSTREYTVQQQVEVRLVTRESVAKI